MSHALLIVDHGSRRPEAHAHLEWIAAQVRARRPELRVYVAHMEAAEPSIRQAIERCAAEGVRELIVHPLFLVPGRHLAEDIPALVESARRLHPELKVRITAPLGAEPGIADLIAHSIEQV
jgi:sirohydrochlorin ferrochelatase